MPSPGQPTPPSHRPAQGDDFGGPVGSGSCWEQPAIRAMWTSHVQWAAIALAFGVISSGVVALLRDAPEGLVFIPFLVAAIGMLLGIAYGIDALRWRRWLRNHGPRPGHAVEGTVRRFLGSDRAAVRVAVEDPTLVVVGVRRGVHNWTDVPFVGLRGGLDGPVVVCAGSRRRIVVLDADVGVPVELLLPRTRRTAERWAWQLEDSQATAGDD